MKKAIFLDIDGTLIDCMDGIKDITPNVKKAIKKVQEKGDYAFISTGRPYALLDKNILDFGFDGFILANGAHVIINNKLAPIIGNVCMDQIMVDATNVGPVKTGDEVILLGKSNNVKYDADDMAKDVGTINYEIICALKNRVPKVYIKNGETIKVINNI